MLVLIILSALKRLSPGIFIMLLLVFFCFFLFQFKKSPPKIPYKAIALATVLFLFGAFLIIIGSLLLAGYISKGVSWRACGNVPWDLYNVSQSSVVLYLYLVQQIRAERKGFSFRFFPLITKHVFLILSKNRLLPQFLWGGWWQIGKSSLWDVGWFCHCHSLEQQRL